MIVDECHHISAFTFEQVMKQVKAKYVVGLRRRLPAKMAITRSSICSVGRSGSVLVPGR